MHAAKLTGNASLRNQLLSNDIGNIDVRYETSVNQQKNSSHDALPQQHQYQYQQPQHQHPPFDSQYQQPTYGYPQQVYPSSYMSAPQASGHHPNQQFYPQPHRYSAPQGSPSHNSRRSSLNSASSNFPFFKGKKFKKSYNGGGDDDDDDDGKDVMIDASQTSTMSFDDLGTMKDRGRYGGQSNYDTTPIIPTLASPSSRPGTGPNNGKISNTQYRKQMTAFKKQAMANAGKIIPGSDPRAMSLQSNASPLVNQDPRSMSLQTGSNPYPGQDPRAMSLQSGNPYLNDPRLRPNGSQPPYYQNDSRVNSLQGQRPPMQNGPRAYSLTTNPYQKAAVPNHLHGRPFPPGPSSHPSQLQGQGLPRSENHRNIPLNANHRSSVPGAPSPLNHSQLPTHLENEQEASAQSGQYKRLSQSRTSNKESVESFPEHSRGSQRGPHSQQQYQPHSNPQAEQQQLEPQSFEKNNRGQHEPLNAPNAPTPEVSPANNSFDQSHHFLADNVQNDANLDSSDVSREQTALTLPNDQSTPSPERKTENDRSSTLELSPSKLPRSKGLPHLSLLSMHDYGSDDEDINQKAFAPVLEQRPYSPEKVQQQSNDFIPRVLEPLDESIPYQTRGNRSSTPPASESQSPFNISPGKSWTSPKKQVSSKNEHGSPHRKQLNSDHSKHSKNSYSISSMSEYSTVSETHHDINGNKGKIYTLAQASSTNNDVYVTASQFSLMDQSNFKPADDQSYRDSEYFNKEDYENQSTIGAVSNNEDDVKTPNVNDLNEAGVFDPEKTPTVDPKNNTSPEDHARKSSGKRLSIDSSFSAKSSSSFRTRFSSPKFLKKWTKKRDERNISNTFEPVTKPIDIENEYPRGDGHSSMVPTPVFKSTPQAVSGVNGAGAKSLDPTRNTSSIDNFGPSLSSSSKAVSLSQESNRQSSTSSTPPSLAKADSLSNSVEPLDKFGNQISLLQLQGPKGLKTEDIGLGDSFTPSEAGSNVKPLILTIDQLGIMEEKTDLIRELDLVSKELAKAIKREIQLEEKLNGLHHIGELKTPDLGDYEIRLRDAASQIADLTQKLNMERKTRYIAEEHVLLHENNCHPSPLKLNYENEELKTKLVDQDELINKLAAEIEGLKSENPLLKGTNEQLVKKLREAEAITIPNLQNKIEFLTNDQKRLSILTEKFKILRAEKQELEKRLEDIPERPFQSYGNGMLGSLSVGNTSVSESRSQSPISVRKTRDHVPPSESKAFEDLVKPSSPAKNRRMTSFPLISVSSSQE